MLHSNRKTYGQDPSVVAATILSIVLRETNSLGEQIDASADPASLKAMRQRQVDVLTQSVLNAEPVSLVILGFPAKSGNRFKTHSPLPDRGEVEALRFLDNLCHRIQAVYEPGARTTVCSDGLVFSDLVGVAADEVMSYQRGILDIIDEFQFKNLHHFCMRDVFGPEMTLADMRASMNVAYGESIDSLRAFLVGTAEGQCQLNGIHRFLFEDMVASRANESRNSLRKAAKINAYQVIQRSQSFGGLVQKHFPGALRLSIHPQALSSWKIGVQMVPAQDRWATPWHNVLLQSGTKMELVPKWKAEALGAAVKTYAGKYAYYEVTR